MLVKPSIEQLLKKVDNRYSLTYVVARRARQLVAGAQPMSNADTQNYVTLACEEIAENQVIAVPRLVDPIVPLRPENEAARIQALIEKHERAMGLEEDDFGSGKREKTAKTRKNAKEEKDLSTEELLASSVEEDLLSYSEDEDFEELSIELLAENESDEDEE